MTVSHRNAASPSLNRPHVEGGDLTASSSNGIARTIVIASTAFLTLVDLFATQALLPALAQAYSVSPAAMGLAVNACTLGMAISSLAVALLGGRIERRRGIWISLALLAVPTLLLSVAPNLITFAALRIAQGIFMAAAFALMLAYLGEHLSARSSATAFAAYVTGNVASNLFGRLFASAIADHLGLAASFAASRCSTCRGALLVYCTVPRDDAGVAATPCRRSHAPPGPIICATARCWPASASGSASCSRSSAPSPTSISCWRPRRSSWG